MLRLLVTHGLEEHVFAMPEREVSLGSTSENDIVLRIPGVSRRHALVRPIPRGVEVADLGSKNRFFVEGHQVDRMVLTPGLRAQIGAAWLEVEEISTLEETLARLHEAPLKRSGNSSSTTMSVKAQQPLKVSSPEDAAFTLALHIGQVGVGLPGKRTDLLLRIKEALGAEVFGTLEAIRSGNHRIWESVGTFSPAETRLLRALARDRRIRAQEPSVLKRAGTILLAGGDSWFLAAKFAEEALAREAWRKEFLLFLASQFFRPVQSLHDVGVAEASRVLLLTKDNKQRAANLLDISRTTLYELLGLFKSKDRNSK